MCKAAGSQQREPAWSKTRDLEGTGKQLWEEEQLSIKKLSVRSPRKHEAGMPLKKLLECPGERQLETSVNIIWFKHPLWSEETEASFTIASQVRPCLPLHLLAWFSAPLQYSRSQAKGRQTDRKDTPCPQSCWGLPTFRRFKSGRRETWIRMKFGVLIIT